MSFRRSSSQFDIRPWRLLAGQSVATAGATSSFRQSRVAGGVRDARRKETWDSPQRPRIRPRDAIDGFIRQCQAASAIALLRCPLPALVMPPWTVLSPLECSEGTSPSHAANALAFPNLENSPASNAMSTVVMMSTPFRQRSESTLFFQRGFRCFRLDQPLL